MCLRSPQKTSTCCRGVRYVLCAGKRLPVVLGKDCLKECLLERYVLCAGKRLFVGKILPVVLGKDCLLQECALRLVCWGKTACWE